MKILQVNVVYDKGSTGKIVYDIHTELESQGIDSVVCYGRGNKVNKPNVYKTCSELYAHLNHLWGSACGIEFGGCFLSTLKLISVIKKQKPDIVHLHCINGYFVNIYKILNWLKKKRIKTVLTLHAEFMYTGGCAHAMDCNKWTEKAGCNHCPRYKSDLHSWFFDRSRSMWNKMKKALSGFDNLSVVSVSPWLKERAENSEILKGKNHLVILNGVDTDIFKPYSEAENDTLKQELGLKNEPVVFHATAFFSDEKEHNKGGYYIIKAAKMLPDVKFVIAGEFKKDIEIPQNVTLLGAISDQVRLAKFYSMADLTLLTSKRETFSMVVAESLCAGTPIVAFNAGAPEQIALKEHSFFTQYGDVDGLTENIKNCIGTKKAGLIADKANVYSKKNMLENYLDLYRGLYKGETEVK